MKSMKNLEAGEGTLPQLLHYWARKQSDKVALREKKDGVWQEYSWANYYDTVRRFALGLTALGFDAGDRLAIAADCCAEWMYADLGAQSLGGQVVGIYPTSPWTELNYILGHSGCRYIVCDGDEQLKKVALAQSEGQALSNLECVICTNMEGIDKQSVNNLLSFEQVLAEGDRYARENLEAISEYEGGVFAGDPDRICMLVYTSGTTGLPKGVQLNSRNVLTTTTALVNEFGFTNENYRWVRSTKPFLLFH